MPAFLIPIVDSLNPMYCPQFPAARYLHYVQQMRHRLQALAVDDSFVHRTSLDFQQSYTHTVESWNREESMDPAITNPAPHPSSIPQAMNANDTVRCPKRKFEESCNHNLLQNRSKRIRSDISQTSSFLLSPDPNQPDLRTLLEAAPLQTSSDGFYQDLFRTIKFDVLRNSSNCSPRHVAALEYELFGRVIGKETAEDVSRLLDNLNRELPGISLAHQLSHLNNVSHQDIMDFLGSNGHLARHVLEYFRASRIQRMDLSSTLCDENGLNVLKPQVVLDVFALPHSFTQLQVLNLDNVQLDDFYLTKIHHLPSLNTLWLNHTGIGNEGVGHLTALKFQLKELQVENNPRIDDDSIPSLCLLSSLNILRIFGTNIQMPGLRRLAIFVHEAQRELDIEIPQECHIYLNELDTHYQLHPPLQMITNPRLCTSLSTNTLKANLAAHAAFNPSISLSGSKVELANRLQDILERRLVDTIVKEVVLGYESFKERSEADKSTF